MVCQNLPCVEEHGQSHKGRAQKAGPRHPPQHNPTPLLTAGDFNSTKPSSGLHSAATRLPLASSVGHRWVSRAPFKFPPARPPRVRLLTGVPRAPRPAAATAPRDTAAGARPGRPSRRGESPWGHVTAGAASGAARGRRRVPGRWKRGAGKRSGVSPARGLEPASRRTPQARGPSVGAAPHLSTRPAGTSTAPAGSGSGSIRPRYAAARPRPRHAPSPELRATPPTSTPNPRRTFGLAWVLAPGPLARFGLCKPKPTPRVVHRWPLREEAPSGVAGRSEAALPRVAVLSGPRWC